MDSSAEECEALSIQEVQCFQSLFQWIIVKKINKSVHDRNMSVWKPKPAVAWMCQVQTSVYWVRNKVYKQEKHREAYEGAISLNGVWEAATYITSSRIVLAFFSPYLPCFLLRP